MGFGLINPNRAFEKRVAFDSFKTMLEELQHATNIKLHIYSDYYELSYNNNSHSGKVLWTNNQTVNYRDTGPFSYLTQVGTLTQSETLQLNATPIYLINKESI